MSRSPFSIRIADSGVRHADVHVQRALGRAADQAAHRLVEPAVALLVGELHVALARRRVQADRHQRRPGRPRGRPRHVERARRLAARCGRPACAARPRTRTPRGRPASRAGRPRPAPRSATLASRWSPGSTSSSSSSMPRVSGSEDPKRATRSRNLLRQSADAPRFARTRAPLQGRSRSRRSRCRRRPRRPRTPRGDRGASVSMRRPPSVVVMPATTSIAVAPSRRSTGAPAASAGLDHLADRAVAHAHRRDPRRPPRTRRARRAGARSTARRRSPTRCAARIARPARCAPSRASRRAARGARSPPPRRARAAPACCARRTRPSRPTACRPPRARCAFRRPCSTGSRAASARARVGVTCRATRSRSAWKPPVASTTGTPAGSSASGSPSRTSRPPRAPAPRSAARVSNRAPVVRGLPVSRCSGRAPSDSSQARSASRRSNTVRCSSGSPPGHSARKRSKSRWRQITPLESSIEPPARSPFSRSTTRRRAARPARRRPGRPCRRPPR